MRPTSKTTTTPLLVGLVITALCGVVACGSDSTSGRQVTLRTQAEADPEVTGEFTTGTGWSVRLSRAAVSLGALYYFDGEPVFARRRQRSLGERIVALLGPSVAHAHPGHYVAGMAVGQMIMPAFAELMAGLTVLPAGEGVSGRYRSARVVLAAPSSEPARAVLGTSVAALEGVARRAEQTVYFKLTADLADVAHGAREAQIDGCPFDEADVASDGLVTVQIKPSIWLDLVDFSEVAPGSAATPTEVPRGQTAQLAFALGVAQLSAYRFSFGP